MQYFGLFIGTLIYARYLKHVTFRKIFFWSQVSFVPFILLDYIQVMRYNVALGIPDFAFVLGSDTLNELFHRFRSMPFFVLSAQLCPKDIEATFFSLLMSISNLSTDAALLIGSAALKWKGIGNGNFDGLGELTLIKAACTIAPVFLLWMVPNVTSLEPTNELAKDQGSEVTTEVTNVHQDSEITLNVPETQSKLSPPQESKEVQL
jgi:hypothetical protein